MTTATAPKPFITVQTGPRNARADPTTGLRFYTWPSDPPVEVPSVTTIQRMAGIPHGLHQWALGQVIKHVVGHADEIAGRLQSAIAVDAKSGPGSPLGLETVTAILGRELRAAATAERDKAAALGTAVHDAAATGRQVVDVDEALRPRLRQYLAWLEASGAVILGSEFQVWNFTEGYAGTADLLVRLRDGKNYLVDLKTGKGIYRDHVTQLMAYLQAEFVGADGIVDTALTEALGTAVGMAVLHLSDSGWEFLAFRPESRVWEAFQGLLRFAVFMSTPGVDDLIVGRREGSAA